MRKAIATLVLSMCGGAIMAADIEEPGFDLLDQFGAVEIRHYEPTIQAQTILASDAATTSGFRRLAGYIFGGNDRGMEIAMTAPVQETLDVEHQTAQLLAELERRPEKLAPWPITIPFSGP